MPITSLRNHLIDTINDYLKEENPEPSKASTLTNVINFFTHHGTEGRVRASDYAKTIKVTDDRELLAKVYADIIDEDENSTLNSSRSLRKYLMQGIYEFIHNERLEGKKEIDLEKLNLALFNYLKLDGFKKNGIVNKRYSEQAVDINPGYAMYDVNSAAPLGVFIHNWTLLSRLQDEVTQEMVVDALRISPKVRKEVLSEDASEVEMSEMRMKVKA